MNEEQNETIENTEVQDLDYEVVKDASIERFFSYDLQVDDHNFWYDDEDNLLGVVVAFKEYPDHETLTSIFEVLLIKAVMQIHDVDEEEAQEMIEDCGSPEEYPDELDVAEAASVLFTVEGHRGLYRMTVINDDYRVSHSTGRKNDRWDI